MVESVTPKQARNGVPGPVGVNKSMAKPSEPVTVPPASSGLARPV